MKEDILEQIVDDYLQFNWYFTTHNVRFKPDASHPDFIADRDRVPSDVDVVALHPTHVGPERVLVVTCKSWQTGFNPRKVTELREDSGPRKRPTWHHFRDFGARNWAESVSQQRVARLTGQEKFIYRIAVTRFQGISHQNNGQRSGTTIQPSGRTSGVGIGFLTLGRCGRQCSLSCGEHRQASRIWSSSSTY